jgi:hypothetical protein
MHYPSVIPPSIITSLFLYYPFLYYPFFSYLFFSHLHPFSIIKLPSFSSSTFLPPRSSILSLILPILSCPTFFLPLLPYLYNSYLFYPSLHLSHSRFIYLSKLHITVSLLSSIFIYLFSVVPPLTYLSFYYPSLHYPFSIL